MRALTLMTRILLIGLIGALAALTSTQVNAAVTTAKKNSKSGVHKASKGKVHKASKKSSKSKKSRFLSEERADLSTDIKFDDSVLHGQYQSPDEALARVEDEKNLSDLLGVRMHFKDRLKQQSEQE